MQQERPLWNPYLAGAFLGLVLLTSFLVLGFGLGSSGAANRTGVAIADTLAHETVAEHPYMGQYVADGKNPFDDWIVFMVVGVFLGGAFGAYSSGRMKRGAVLRGPNMSRRNRLILALAGGIVMGFAARLARGCTSGQALTGGALLSVGSWIFMMAVFAGGYLTAPFVRRQWR